MLVFTPFACQGCVFIGWLCLKSVCVKVFKAEAVNLISSCFCLFLSVFATTGCHGDVR